MLDFDELKRIDLTHYCLNELGYEVVRDKSCKRWPVLESPYQHKILIAPPAKGTGHYLWRFTTGDKWGTIIDLLQEIHGLAISNLPAHFGSKYLGFEKPNPSPSAPPPPSPTPKPITLIPFEKSTRDNYLTNRGISLKTMEVYGIGATHKVTFPLWRLGKERGFELQTAIEYVRVDGCSRSFFKGQRSGSLSIIRPLCQKGTMSDCSEVYLFESPIDALSFYELHPPTSSCYYLVSLCGNPGKYTLDLLPKFLDRLKAVTIYLCLDNDSTGRKLSGKITEAASVLCIDLFLNLMDSKDWNEFLITTNGKKI